MDIQHLWNTYLLNTYHIGIIEIARGAPLAGIEETMLIQAGDLWHCTNPACRSELSIGATCGVEVDHLYCACGSVMKKHYTRPVFRYLDFLGNRDVTAVLPAVPEVQLQSNREE